MIFCTFAMHKISWQNIKDLLYKNIVHTHFVIKEIDFYLSQARFHCEIDMVSLHRRYC